jgi:hypothetical protein
MILLFIIIIFALIVITLIILNIKKNNNKFEDIKYDIKTTNPLHYDHNDIENIINNDSKDNNYYYLHNKKSCYIVEKKYIEDNNKGKFIYSKIFNKDCNPNLYKLNSNIELYFDNIDNIGSCRNNNSNKECIDFVDKNKCENYNKISSNYLLPNKINNMIWSNKTCHDHLDYKWIDKINLNINKIK